MWYTELETEGGLVINRTGDRLLCYTVQETEGGLVIDRTGDRWLSCGIQQRRQALRHNRKTDNSISFLWSVTIKVREGGGGVGDNERRGNL